MMNKYNARRATAPDGQRFDSVKEMNRYCELKLLERSGKIRDLRRQVKFELVPVQRGESPGVYKAGPQKGMPKYWSRVGSKSAQTISGPPHSDIPLSGQPLQLPRSTIPMLT